MFRLATNPRHRPTRRALVLLGLTFAASAVAAPADGLAIAGKSTKFVGKVTSGTGRYVKLRGAVRLVLGTSPATAVGPGSTTTHYNFVLTLSAPKCAGQSHCVALAGRLSGTAVGTRQNPDVGTAYALAGHGSVSPLGAVAATGTTHSIGFIAHGSFPLSLRLRNASGTLTITAQGPAASPGFTSPF